MRGVDLGAKVRNVSRMLGVEVDLIKEAPIGIELGQWRFRVEDPDLGPLSWVVQRKSDPAYDLGKFHEHVYHERGRLVYELQKELCALCGGRMRTYEIDHIDSRGAHGRNDRIGNLQAVHPSLTHSCHRERHGLK